MILMLSALMPAAGEALASSPGEDAVVSINYAVLGYDRRIEDESLGVEIGAASRYLNMAAALRLWKFQNEEVVLYAGVGYKNLLQIQAGLSTGEDTVRVRTEIPVFRLPDKKSDLGYMGVLIFVSAQVEVNLDNVIHGEDLDVDRYSIGAGMMHEF